MFTTAGRKLVGGHSAGRSYDMVILAPAQLKPAPTPVITVPVVDSLDGKIMEAVGQPDGEPVALWPVIHEIIEAEHPVDRTQQRRLCSRLLCRLRGLIRSGKIVRESKSHVRLGVPLPALVPALNPAPEPVKNWPPSAFATVADMSAHSGGGPRRRVFSV